MTREPGTRTPEQGWVGSRITRMGAASGRSVGRLQLTRRTKCASGRGVCRGLPPTFTGGGSALVQTGPAVFRPRPRGMWGNV